MPDPSPSAAPTLAEIAANGWDLTVHCPACRMLTALNAGGLRAPVDRPVDQMVWRCRRCGGDGAPRVTAPGNALVGRPLIWPLLVP